MRRLRVRWTLDITFGEPQPELDDEPVERAAAVGYVYTPPEDPEWDEVDTNPVGFGRH